MIRVLTISEVGKAAKSGGRFSTSPKVIVAGVAIVAVGATAGVVATRGQARSTISARSSPGVPAAAGPPAATLTLMNWYALVVKPNHKKVVLEHLKTAGFQACLALYRARHRWCGSHKGVDPAPLPRLRLLPLLLPRPRGRPPSPSLAAVVSAGPNPAPVPAREIAAIEA